MELYAFQRRRWLADHARQAGYFDVVQAVMTPTVAKEPVRRDLSAREPAVLRRVNDKIAAATTARVWRAGVVVSASALRVGGGRSHDHRDALCYAEFRCECRDLGARRCSVHGGWIL